MPTNEMDGLLRVGMDMSGVEKATPKAIQAFKALEREALKSTGAIATRGKQNLDQLGAAATAMQSKMAAVNTARSAPGLSQKVSTLGNQIVAEQGRPGATQNTLTRQIALEQYRVQAAKALSNVNTLSVSAPQTTVEKPPRGPTPNALLANERVNTWAAALGSPDERIRVNEEREKSRRLTALVRASLRKEDQPLSVQQMGRLQSAAEVYDKRRTERLDAAKAKALKLEDDNVQKMGRLYVQAREMERAYIQKMGRIHSQALKINDDLNRKAEAEKDTRTQRMGRLQSAGEIENARRTRQMGLWQSAAEVEDVRRTRRFNVDHEQALRMNERFDANRARGGWFRRHAGRIGSGIASGLGIGVAGFGGYAAIQGARAVVESTQTATAYNRQLVAAKELAGGQKELNELLEAYESASGGAIAKTTELGNVTRLLATGFASSAEEVERYVRATRGAAIALGKPEDYVIQETQLAISNTSVKRLDQIGLGIKEVNDEIERLRATNKDWNRETAFGEAVIGLMEKKYGALTETLEGQATGLERLRKAWADLYLQMGQTASGPVNTIAGSLATGFTRSNEQALMNQEVRQNLKLNPNWKPDINTPVDPYRQDAFDVVESVKAGQRSEKAIKGFWDSVVKYMIDQAYLAQGRAVPEFGPEFRDPVPAWMTSATGSAMPRPTGRNARSEEAQKLIDDNWKQVQDIEKSYNKARLDEIRSYEEQRANTIRDYGRQMAREEEDFFRQRARSLRDYERSIVDLMRDSQERDAEMREDLEDKIADAREDSGKKIAEIEKEFNESREEAAKEHRDALMKAAGQLDAIAVLEERKRWRRDQEQANKQHDKALKNEKENLEEKIKEAREAYEEQLEDARKADAKRLEDMRVNRERQLADEDEDRAIRLARAAEDHDLQLEEMDRQHGLRMTQIAEQAEEERAALEEAFGFALNEVGIYVAGFQKKMEERDALIEAWFGRVVDRLEREVRAEQGTDYYYDPKTGPKIPTNYTTPLASASSVTVSGGKSIVIQPGAIVVNAHPAMDEERVANFALSKLVDTLEEMDR